MLRPFMKAAGAAVLLFILATGMLNDDGRAGRTGSPGEGTCHGCHDDFLLNSGGGSIALGSEDLFGWQYVPGTTYHMSCTVAREGTGLFGMGLEALTTSNTNAGTLVITDPASTQIKNATVQGVQRRNVVHTLNGGTGEGAKTFTFDWTAPEEDIGNVTFYFAGVAANGDGNEEVGDYVYTGSQVVQPGSVNAIAGAAEPAGAVNVYPDPVADRMNLGYSLRTSGRVQVDLFDMNGRLMSRSLDAERQPGRHVEMIDGMAAYPAGPYVLRCRIAGVTTTRTIVLRGEGE